MAKTLLLGKGQTLPWTAKPAAGSQQKEAVLCEDLCEKFAPKMPNLGENQQNIAIRKANIINKLLHLRKL
jgi:hypothetical protein